MSGMNEGAGLTASQIEDLWERHTQSEFETSSVEATIETMTENPHVDHVPMMTGGVGRDEVIRFCTERFIPKQAPNTELTFVSRTIGEDRIVDELIFGFTDTVEMDWILPGVPPTGKRVRFPLAVVIGFEDGKIDSEHIYWDQASVLVQTGLLDPENLPVVGAEAARKAFDPTSVPSNELIERATKS